MAIPVKLEVFEGPLDLLLHLIDKNKVDIYDIPIVEITEQYLDYIKQMETEDMNVMSEFLVMAATLIDIKCRMLKSKEGVREKMDAIGLLICIAILYPEECEKNEDIYDSMYEKQDEINVEDN